MTVRKRRRRNRKKVLPVLLAVILSLAIFTGAYGFASDWYFPNPFKNRTLAEEDGEDLTKLEGFNVLLLGTDERDGEGIKSRTDSIIVLNYNDKENRISMLSIPRDSRVTLPGRGIDKINAANVYGGPELAVKTVSELIDMPIKYYVLANFEGFANIVDSLGGVTIDVERDMYHYDDVNPKHSINLKKGKQLLDGDKALQYVRFRGDADGDISRTGRQLTFLKALAGEMMQPKTLAKMHKVVPALYENVETNLGLSQLLSLAKAGRNLDSIEIVTQTLPGRFLDTDYGSYWEVDKPQAVRVASALFNEGKVVDVMQGPTRDLRASTVMLSQNNSTKDNSSTAEKAQPAGDKRPESRVAGNDAPSETEPLEGSNQGNGDKPVSTGPETDMNEGTEPSTGETQPPGGLPGGLPEEQGSNWGVVEIYIETDGHSYSRF
ncbi:MAG: LCP family protein [Clostridiaceae bacterium]|nr:LCP family protein [Clostridiaceae bacterium]